MVGRAREALAELEQEKARDPLNPYTSLMLAVAYSSVRNFPASIAEFDRGYSLDPSMQFQFQISTLSNALGTRDRAEIRRLQVQISSAPGARPELGSQMIPLLDKPADALVHLQKQLRDPSTPVLQLAGVSQWLAYFGDAKTALEAHRRALEHRATMPAAFSIWFPVMSEVRKLPEFKQLVRDIGLVDYWKKYGWGDFCKPTTGDDFECT
jgi:tetratricopeptide (TPR) repeat protein